MVSFVGAAPICTGSHLHMVPIAPSKKNEGCPHLHMVSFVGAAPIGTGSHLHMVPIVPSKQNEGCPHLYMVSFVLGGVRHCGWRVS